MKGKIEITPIAISEFYETRWKVLTVNSFSHKTYF